jgi:hypothetical protein
MTTSFLEEQRERLETLLNDLSVRQQQANLPLPEFLPSPSQAVFGGSAAASSSRAEPPSFSSKNKE